MGCGLWKTTRTQVSGKLEPTRVLQHSKLQLHPPVSLAFDNFNLRAIYTGQRLNLAGTRLVPFQANETVAINAKDVPEPASLAIMTLGLGLVGFSRRRRNQAA